MSIKFSEWPKISRLNRDIVITEKLDGTNAAIGIVLEPPDPNQPGVGGGYTIYAQSRTRIITPQDDNMGFARWVERNRDVLIRTLGEGLHHGEWWGVGIQRGYDLSERRFSLFNTAKWGEGIGAAALAAAREDGVAIYSVPVLYAGPWTGVFGYVDGTDEIARPWLQREQMQDWPEVQANFAEAERRAEVFMSKYFTDLAVAGHDSTEVTKDLVALFDVNPRPRFAPSFILEHLKRTGSQAAPGFMQPEGICIFHKASSVVFKATIEKDQQHKGQG